MENPIKTLASQTAIYGMGTIIPRLLNYLLVPLYVRVFATGVYGQITDLYAWIAFLLALLTYGMETTFFRFTKTHDPKKVYNNIISCILTTTTIFIIAYSFLYKDFARIIQYEHNTQYVLLIGIIVAFDALTAVPFAKLRNENKAKRFTLIKISNVLLNIGLNLFFLLVIPEKALAISDKIFGHEAGLLIWVLISNILSSMLSLILLLPQFKSFKYQIDGKLLKTMLSYSIPILLLSLVGMVNEVADKILIKYLIPIPDQQTLDSLGITPTQYTLQQLGIYGANFKLAVLMTIFIQMFRYASEPFFFDRAKDKNSPKLFARVMTYFVAFCLLIFLGVMLYIDIIKYFIGGNNSAYHEGLIIVPIILIANMFNGIVFNLSFWFKLRDKTYCGTIIATIGAVITIIGLFFLVPKIGYIGAALAHLTCYTVMMVVSYCWGQKEFPIPYQVGRITIYFVIAMAIFATSMVFRDKVLYVKLIINTILLIIYIATIIILERKNPLSYDVKNS
ncbi:MAG: lipopolysaccharide biosynthesis protein [Candidatus Limimorpha sp.]